MGLGGELNTTRRSLAATGFFCPANSIIGQTRGLLSRKNCPAFSIWYGRAKQKRQANTPQPTDMLKISGDYGCWLASWWGNVGQLGLLGRAG